MKNLRLAYFVLSVTLSSSASAGTQAKHPAANVEAKRSPASQQDPLFQAFVRVANGSQKEAFLERVQAQLSPGYSSAEAVLAQLPNVELYEMPIAEIVRGEDETYVRKEITLVRHSFHIREGEYHTGGAVVALMHHICRGRGDDSRCEYKFVRWIDLE